MCNNLTITLVAKDTDFDVYCFASLQGAIVELKIFGNPAEAEDADCDFVSYLVF